MSEQYMPSGETVENERDKKRWYWEECLEYAESVGCPPFSLEFWVVYKIRVYETHGRYDVCIAGAERLAEDLRGDAKRGGITVKAVEDAITRACMKKRLHRIFCDKRVFRNKTKLVVTGKWAEEHELLDRMDSLEVGKHGANLGSYLSRESSDLEDDESKVVVKEKEKKERKTTFPEVEATCGSVETTFSGVETTFSGVVLPHMNECENECENECNEYIGDSNESCVCNEDSSRKENLKESEDLVEDKSLEETSLNGNLAGVAEAEVVAEEAKGVKVPPADNVGSSPSEEHSLEANESRSKAGLDVEMVNGKGESKKKPRKGNKRVVFSPPSIEEIQEYCNSRNNGLDAEEFWAYYESRGWYVGKNKMKSWKAAVITWEKRNREWGKGNQRNQNTGLVRGDAMYEPRDGEDLTYQRMFEFWRKAIGASVPQTVSQVEACRALLADVGEEWVERMIVARAMSVKTPFTTKEVKGIQGFIELADRRSLMMSYYNEHWEKWKEQQRREQLGKKPWEV